MPLYALDDHVPDLADPDRVWIAPDARIALATRLLTPDQFVVAVRRPAGNESEPWPHLVQCFARATGDTTNLKADDGWLCELEKLNGAWKLRVFFQDPD